MSKYSDFINTGDGGEPPTYFDLGENITAGELVRIVNDSGTKVMKVTSSYESETVGMLQETGTTGQNKKVVLLEKRSDIHTGQTVGQKVYIQTDGSYSSVVTEYPIGRYISDTVLLLTKTP